MLSVLKYPKHKALPKASPRYRAQKASPCYRAEAMKRQMSSALDTSASTRQLALALAEDPIRLQNQTAAELYQQSLAETPYGPIMREIQMGQLNVNVLDPRTHIYAICEDSACFADFLATYLPNGVGHLVMYMDELKPGNQHLPGKGRSLHACYFNILEFPDWFLSDAGNWMSLAYISSLDMERAQVKESQVLRYLLRYMFSLGASEPLGSCDFRCKRNGEYMVIRLKFGCYVADCKSLFQFASSKGASALVPCPECLNVKKNPTPPGEVGG